ncbi:MAG: inositol monophosphatase family protein, partial [Gemmatimonadota bacterium]|nr:inositol monophosphatase family protein [Gemmatimonadota bacterium]
VVADVEFARRLDAAEDACHPSNVIRREPPKQRNLMPLPTSTQRTHWRDVAISAAAHAAAFIAQESLTRHTITWEEKSATDFVSHVDLGAEAIIRRVFAEQAPDIGIVGEELGGGSPVSGLVAIVDPLDGTTNFLHGFPNYGVSICVALDGVPQAAVIHDVSRGGTYHAIAGGGAFRDERPLHVSTLATHGRALIGTGIPFKDITHADRYLGQLRRLMPVVSGVRRAGSAALDLCDVTAGRFDAFWELYLNPWDLAAGILLVREAGGRVTDLDGRDAGLEGGPIVASNGILHEWFLGVLRDEEPARSPQPA